MMLIIDRLITKNDYEQNCSERKNYLEEVHNPDFDGKAFQQDC